jgi:hypothetical protein
MKLDERMHDLEGGMNCMRDAAEELIKVKEKIIPPPPPQMEEKIVLPKSNSRKKKKLDSDLSEKIMNVEIPVDAEDSTIAEDGGEF